MFFPNKSKYSKFFKFKTKSHSSRGIKLHFGNCGLRAIEEGILTPKKLEGLRLFLQKKLKRQGKIWFRVFPNIGVSKKPLEVRMGKGKGALDHYVSVVKPGRIMFEMDGVPMEVAKEALRLAAQKLPVQTKFVVRKDYVE